MDLPEETVMTGMIALTRKLADDLTTAVQVGTTKKTAAKEIETDEMGETRRETGTMIGIDPDAMTGILETGIGTEKEGTGTAMTGTTEGDGTSVPEMTTVDEEMIGIETIGAQNLLGRLEVIVNMNETVETEREHHHRETIDILPLPLELRRKRHLRPQALDL